MLENSLDYGIAEKDFWEMTFAEINRLIKSKQRVRDIEAQERASYDYILADLIGKSVARIYSSSSTMPAIEEAYPAIFGGKVNTKAELSALRFKQFAASYNAKNNKEVAKVNE